MVRDTLGDDAVIVATREEQGGKAVRVTAAIDPRDPYGDDSFARQAATPARPSPQRPTSRSARRNDDREEQDRAREWLQYDEENDDENAVIEKIIDVMLRHAVADEIVDQIVSCATVIGANRPDIALTAALEHLYSYRPLPLRPVDKAFMLVGPPGAGKTLATAKLAARAVLQGLRVAVISTDTIRAGGIEQLGAFTKLLRIKLQTADNGKDLQAALAEARASGAEQIYVDTGGYNPFAPEEMRDLARLIAAGDIEPILVLPGGIDADESGEMARIYATLGVHCLLPTRLDISRRFGGLLGAAHHGSLVFADASDTPKVADGLLPLSPARLAQLLMPESQKEKTSTHGRSSQHGRKRTTMSEMR